MKQVSAAVIALVANVKSINIRAPPDVYGRNGENFL